MKILWKFIPHLSHLGLNPKADENFMINCIHAWKSQFPSFQMNWGMSITGLRYLASIFSLLGYEFDSIQMIEI